MPRFILEMRVATAASRLMQPCGWTLPAPLCMVSDIVIEARSWVGEHVQVGIAVNRRGKFPVRIRKTDKDVVVIFDSCVGRWTPRILDFQSNVVVRVDNVVLEDGGPILRYIDVDSSIASTAKQTQFGVVSLWRAGDRVGHGPAIADDIVTN